MTAGRAQESTPEQLAEKVRASLLHLQAWLRPGAMKWSRDGLDALSELVARLAAETTAREQAEKERDDVTAELAALLAEFKLQRDDRDRLTAALERIAGLDRQIDLAKQIAREALNPGDAT